MIVFGSRTKGELVPGIEPFNDYCPECRRTRTFFVKKPVTRFTLYFIPTFKMGGDEGMFQECNICETAYVYNSEKAGSREEQATFLLIISAIGCMIKADGKILDEEVGAAFGIICRIFNLDDQDAKEIALGILLNEVNSESNTADQIASGLSSQIDDFDFSRLLLNTLLFVACADDELDESEIRIAAKFGRAMGISASEVKTFVAEHRDRMESDIPYGEAHPSVNPYEVLGIPSNASASEVKSAYQTLVTQYHPDKVAHLGLELQELAKRKTAEINAAYQAIR